MKKLAALFLFLTACHGARLATPNGFATFDDDGYSYRASSANGVVIATRTEANDVKANLDYWAEALDIKLREKGYASEGAAHAVTTSNGLVGTQIRYTKSIDGRDYRYWMTVFVSGKKVYVVEAGGDREPFDKSTSTVESAIASLDVSR